MPGDKKKRTGEKRQSAGKITGPARESLPAGPVVRRPKKCLHFQARYSIINPVTNKPVCRNGRRCGLKIRWWQHRVGSSPTTGTTSEWTTLHSKSPAVWLGFSHTAPSFLLFPTKLCCANFRGDPALRAKEGSRHQFHHANAKIPNARAFGIFPYSPFTFHSSLILCSPLGIFRSE